MVINFLLFAIAGWFEIGVQEIAASVAGKRWLLKVHRDGYSFF